MSLLIQVANHLLYLSTHNPHQSLVLNNNNRDHQIAIRQQSYRKILMPFNLHYIRESWCLSKELDIITSFKRNELPE
jgi:hypothetical protein